MSVTIGFRYFVCRGGGGGGSGSQYEILVTIFFNDYNFFLQNSPLRVLLDLLEDAG